MDISGVSKEDFVLDDLDSLTDTILQTLVLHSVQSVIDDYYEALQHHDRADAAMVEALDAFNWERAGESIEAAIMDRVVGCPGLRAGIKEILKTAIIGCGRCGGEINFPYAGEVAFTSGTQPDQVADVGVWTTVHLPPLMLDLRKGS